MLTICHVFFLGESTVGTVIVRLLYFYFVPYFPETKTTHRWGRKGCSVCWKGIDLFVLTPWWLRQRKLCTWHGWSSNYSDSILYKFRSFKKDVFYTLITVTRSVQPSRGSGSLARGPSESEPPAWNTQNLLRGYKQHECAFPLLYCLVLLVTAIRKEHSGRAVVCL